MTNLLIKFDWSFDDNIHIFIVSKWKWTNMLCNTKCICCWWSFHLHSNSLIYLRVFASMPSDVVYSFAFVLYSKTMNRNLLIWFTHFIGHFSVNHKVMIIIYPKFELIHQYLKCCCIYSNLVTSTKDHMIEIWDTYITSQSKFHDILLFPLFQSLNFKLMNKIICMWWNSKI